MTDISLLFSSIIIVFPPVILEGVTTTEGSHRETLRQEILLSLALNQNDRGPGNITKLRGGKNWCFKIS